MDRLTLLDVASRTHDKRIMQVAETLKQFNPILDDMSFLEANDGTGHKGVIRTGLPDVAWRLLNYGVKPSKSQTKQVRDDCGMLEAYSEPDASLPKIKTNKDLRWTEDMAFLEKMAQVISTALFKGNAKTEEAGITGLAPRYSKLTAPLTGPQIIDAGQSGDPSPSLTSIYLVAWGPLTVHGIYPEGSKAGISFKDLGEQTKTFADGSQMQVLRTHYKWDVGLHVRDYRYIVRIANVNVKNLSAISLGDLCMEAHSLLPSDSLGAPVFYCSRAALLGLKKELKNASNVYLTLEAAQGAIKQPHADGVPVKRCDAITNDEAAVV
jgi:hypothetical protein